MKEEGVDNQQEVQEQTKQEPKQPMTKEQQKQQEQAFKQYKAAVKKHMKDQIEDLSIENDLLEEKVTNMKLTIEQDSLLHSYTTAVKRIDNFNKQMQKGNTEEK